MKKPSRRARRYLAALAKAYMLAPLSHEAKLEEFMGQAARRAKWSAEAACLAVIAGKRL